MNSRSPDAAVSEIIRISADAHKIVTYKPETGSLRAEDQLDTPAPLPTHYSQYVYDSLPRKYWKKYHYASRFICTVKSKTPKVTYFSNRAKCMLMESGTDFEAVFYQGPKFTICGSADTVRVIDSCGMNIIMLTELVSNFLSAEVQEMLT